MAAAGVECFVGAYVVVGDVAFDDLLLPGSTSYLTANVVKRATLGAVMTSSASVFDDFANMVEGESLGCISGCIQGTDEAIRIDSVFELLNPTGDAWLWAATEDESRGSEHPDRVIRGRKVYNVQGDLLKTYGVLEGTLALDRFHVTGAPIAPVPPGASGGIGAPVEVITSDGTVNAYGQSTSARGPNGQCASVEFDPQYSRFAVRSKTYVGNATTNGCGATELVSQLTYDAAFGQVTDTVTPQGEVGRVVYDAFGRVVAAYGQDPEQPGTLTTLPVSTVEYLPPTNWATQPYSVIVQRKQDGATPNDNEYFETYTFIDGIGRTFATFSEADPNAGDGGDYVVGGLVTHDSHGNPIQICLPSFHSGSPHTFDLGAPPNTDCISRDIDAFGRLVTEYDLDGTVTAHYKYHAQSVDAYDAADVLAGERHGTFSTSYVDGHNRQILNIGRTRDDNGSLREIRTRNEYLPSGELVQLTRETDGQPSVTRWMRYDTFGRLVLNVEPNTSVGFTADRNVSLQSLKAFRYAYNDSGALVGTSDARGCGANFFYDAGGRPVGSDVSPCEADHAPYSAPNLVTGDGLESFQRYDAYPSYVATITDASGALLAPNAAFVLGRPTVAEDQGTRSVVKYDAAGRGIAAAVQVVKPGQAYSAPAARYAKPLVCQPLDVRWSREERRRNHR